MPSEWPSMGNARGTSTGNYVGWGRTLICFAIVAGGVSVAVAFILGIGSDEAMTFAVIISIVALVCAKRVLDIDHVAQDSEPYAEEIGAVLWALRDGTIDAPEAGHLIAAIRGTTPEKGGDDADAMA